MVENNKKILRSLSIILMYVICFFLIPPFYWIIVLMLGFSTDDPLTPKLWIIFCYIIWLIMLTYPIVYISSIVLFIKRKTKKYIFLPLYHLLWVIWLIIFWWLIIIVIPHYFPISIWLILLIWTLFYYLSTKR